MTAAAARSPQRAVSLLLGAIACAGAVRVLAGGARPAASPLAALLFSALLVLAAATSGGLRPDGGGMRLAWVLAGLAAGGLLVAVSLVGLPSVRVAPRAAGVTLAWWAPLVTTVAISEELVFRGALFSALRHRRGDGLALAVTSIAFALVHVPLYGWGAVPVDLCAGVVLGTLRLLSGGVEAPAAAHVIADLATGWIGA